MWEGRLRSSFVPRIVGRGLMRRGTSLLSIWVAVHHAHYAPAELSALVLADSNQACSMSGGIYLAATWAPMKLSTLMYSGVL